MKATQLITSVTALFLLAAASAVSAKSTVNISTPGGVEDWATSELWSEGVPTIADDANVTSGSANKGTLVIGETTDAVAKSFGVDDNARLKIEGSLTLASGAQLYIGDNAEVTVAGGELSVGTIAVNYGKFTATAGSTINGNINYSTQSNVSITGSTVNAGGSNFFNGGGGTSGQLSTVTFDSTTVNGASGSLFFLGGGDSTRIFNFNNGTVINAYTTMEDGFVTASGQNARFGWGAASHLDVEVNLNGGSQLYVGDLHMINNDGSGIASGQVVFNMQGEEGKISKISTTVANLGLSTTAGATLRTEINMKGYSDFKSNGGITVGSNVAKGGAASFNITGQGNSVYAKGGLGIGRGDDGANAKATVSLRGSGNTISVQNVDIGSNRQTNMTNVLEVVGANTFTARGTTTVGYGDSSVSGVNRIYAKGVDASNLAYLQLDSGLNIWASTNASSTVVNEVVLDGYADLRRINSGAWIGLNIANKASYQGGTARLIIRGEGNFLGAWSTSIGHADMTGGKAVLRIEGAGSQVNINNVLNLYGGVGTSIDNHVGGVLEFGLTDAGISRLYANRIDTFTGILLVDFTLMTNTYEMGQTFELISSNNSLKAIYDALIADNRIDVNLRQGDLADAAQFSLSADEKTIYVTYTSTVPEPAAYAAAFGALALAFAAYRRRK